MYGQPRAFHLQVWREGAAIFQDHEEAHKLLGKGSNAPQLMILMCHMILHLLVRHIYEGSGEILHSLLRFNQVRVSPNTLNINMVIDKKNMFRTIEHPSISSCVNTGKLVAPVAEEPFKLLGDTFISLTYMIDQALLTNTKLEHDCLLPAASRSKLDVGTYNLLLRSSKGRFNLVDSIIRGCRKVGVDCADGDPLMSRDIECNSKWIYGHWKNVGRWGMANGD